MRTRRQQRIKEKRAEKSERQGFEPWKGFPLTVFKTAAFDRSATSPTVCAVYPRWASQINLEFRNGRPNNK